MTCKVFASSTITNWNALSRETAFLNSSARVRCKSVDVVKVEISFYFKSMVLTLNSPNFK